METLEFNRFEGILQTLVTYAIKYGLQLLIAILILLVGFWLAGKLTKSLKKLMEARKLEPTLRSFVLSIVNIVLKILVVIIVLTTVGVQMTSIIAVLGAASLAIGMALSGTLQNFAGGVVIMVLKPFKVGDYIVDSSGREGTVDKIMIFTTQIHTADNKSIFLPNGALSNGAITNFSREGKRRVALVTGISYGDDVEKAREILLAMFNADPRVLKDPEPKVVVSALAANSVDITAYYWAKIQDILSSQADFTEQIYKTFPKNGLSFPFPQMDVHLTK
ncbi:MAG: mechanosensitive ion channel [Prevotellaceae bacterium]|jgi:small conductance mechanosensitive channel|nr:mechanosensitive ion channel [Prevotellaceae bacterium]